MDPTKTPEQLRQEKESLNKLKVIRFALLSWWKKKRTFYIHVQPSGTHPNEPLMDEGATKLRVDGNTDDDSSENCVPKSKEESGESSSSSSSYMDVTSITSLRDPLQALLSQPYKSTSNCNHGHTEHPQDSIQNSQTALLNLPNIALDTIASEEDEDDEVFLSRPFPFTPRRSVSSASLQSMDSWEFSDDDHDESLVPPQLETKSTDSFPVQLLSINSTNNMRTGTIHDRDGFFEQHVLFLRNQTQPQRVQELQLMQSKETSNIDYLHASSK